MHSKILSGPLMLALSIAGFLCSLAVLFHVIPQDPLENSFGTLTANAAVISKKEKINPDLPVRLKIPSIKVNAAIEHVGLTADGAMDVPKAQSNVAWFELGQRPGEIGTAVIDGHYGRKNGKPSVFDNLYKVRIGDKIYVEDGKKISTTFIVREIRKFNPRADATDVFGSDDDKSHLNLITCDGVWNKVTKGFPNRLVVFADKE